MNKVYSRLKNYQKNIFTYDSLIKTILFLIPLLGIFFKTIIFQGFISNKDPYSLNLLLGFNRVKPFIGYYLSFILVFLSFSLLFKGKGRIIYLFFIDAFITALVLLDLAYFKSFQTLPILLLTQTANLDNIAISSMFS